MRLHFGLGTQAKADRIMIKWPNRSLKVTEHKDVPAGPAIEIDEETGTYRTLWSSPGRQ